MQKTIEHRAICRKEPLLPKQPTQSSRAEPHDIAIDQLRFDFWGYNSVGNRMIGDFVLASWEELKRS